MRSALLAAVTILVAITASAWSQEARSSPPSLVQAPGGLASDAAEVESAAAEDPPEPVPEDGTAPSLGDDSSYFDSDGSNFGNSPQAGNGYRFWASAEMLVWWLTPGHTPPLATSGTTSSLGALGPGTTTLFGGNQSNDPWLGGRFTAGLWLDPGQTIGLEGSYFFLNNTSNDNFTASNSGDPASTTVLARPFINAITGLQDSQLLSFPGIFSGSTHITSGSMFQGAQLNGLCNLCCCNSCCCTGCCPPCGQAACCYQTGYRVDLIGGFTWLQLNENLVIAENITVLPTAPSPPFVPGSTIVATDRFETRNNFYGGQIGARAEWWRGAWFTNVRGIVAMGDNHEQVTINGTTVFTSPGGAPVTQRGGLLALPTNIGTYNRDQFSVIPQLGLNVGRQLTNNFRVFVGYTVMYWSNVVRPGDQIDPVVNPTQLPTPTGPGTLVGPARPAFAFHESALWAQGINFGVEFRW